MILEEFDLEKYLRLEKKKAMEDPEYLELLLKEYTLD